MKQLGRSDQYQPQLLAQIELPEWLLYYLFR
jgi:hypothetical protein